MHNGPQVQPNHQKKKMTTTRPPLPPLLIPTTDDFVGMAKLSTIAFKEKQGCESTQESEDNQLKAYRQYASKYPGKLQNCRILKDETSGLVIASCQLQGPNDPPDLSFPSFMRHELSPGEVYLEVIACHPDHTGKGLGSHLLKWADDHAKNVLKAEFLSLQVMQRNIGAAKLYERKGYVVTRNPHDGGCLGQFCTGLSIFCLLGFKYWKILYMVKDLKGEHSPSKDTASDEPPITKDPTKE